MNPLFVYTMVELDCTLLMIGYSTKVRNPAVPLTKNYLGTFDPQPVRAILMLQDSWYITTMLKLQRQPIKVAFSSFNKNIVI